MFKSLLREKWKRYLVGMDNSYKIHTIDLNFLGHPNGIAAFLIESTEGPILVETGPHSTLSTLLDGINKLGYKKEDIQHVLLTHIHLDHAGAAWCFADHGANIYLHPFGYRHMNDPSKLLASAKMIYKEHMDRLWGTLKPISANQLIQVDHNQIISIGNTEFKALHTPGHAKHHIAWRLDDVIFAGDVAGVCINNGPVIPPCPPPDIDIEAWINSIKLLGEQTDIKSYYLTHFGIVNELETHNQLLRESLTAYSQFTKPYAEKGSNVAAMLPAFQEFVEKYLVSHGMSSKDAAAYEAANPSDMSVTGLLRYWSKRLAK